MSATIHQPFEHTWQAEILSARPLILPRSHFTYPAVVEEVEKNALEVLVTPQHSSNSGAASIPEKFLATFALGFRSSAVANGIYSTPHSDWLCALSGGYAYLVNTLAPSEFTMLELRPVLDVIAATDTALLLFIGNRRIIAWGANGLAWQSENLSDEGITAPRIAGAQLHARGWNLLRDQEFEFALDLATGKLL